MNTLTHIVGSGGDHRGVTQVTLFPRCSHFRLLFAVQVNLYKDRGTENHSSDIWETASLASLGCAQTPLRGVSQ